MIEKTMNPNSIGLILVHDKLCNTIDFVPKFILATLHVIVTESREMPAAE